MSDQASLFDMEALAPGEVVLMAAPKHAEFPRLCAIHPVGVGWSCRYGACEREAAITARRREGEIVGLDIRQIDIGQRIRDIYTLDEFVLLSKKKGTWLLRLESNGPGRWGAIGDEHADYGSGGARYEVVPS